MPKPKKIEPIASRPAEVQQVVKWILSGAGAHEIFEAIEAAFPTSIPAQLMKEAMDHFQKQANFDPEIVQGWCFEASRDLYRRMVESGDYPGALRAVKQIAEMAKNVYREQEAERDEAAAGSSEAIQ